MPDPAPESAGTPVAAVPGIHDYCDRWCERCAFQQRCQCYQTLARDPVQPDDVAEAVVQASFSLRRAIDALRATGGVGVEPAPAPVDGGPCARQWTDRHSQLDVDPLVWQSREYARMTWSIVRVLGPVVAARGDAAASAAVDVIGWLSGTIAAKTFRALAGVLEDGIDPADPQNDANGSAKVARLAIDESRRSWRVLMDAGRATADGVPARLVRWLDELDAGLAARFPAAMAFVRPGFDTDPR
jgi:hypothetical protein